MELAQRIVAILFPLFAIVALGIWVGVRQRPEMGVTNRLNMDVFVPALVFHALASKPLDWSQFGPLALAALVLVIGSGAAGWLLAKAMQRPAKTVVPPMMFNNCGNLGIPLALLAFGERAVPAAVTLFLVSNLLHFSYGVWLLDHRFRWWQVWRVPVVLASFAGVAVGMSGVTLWPPLNTAIEMVGQIAIPLMLFALGVRLATAQITAFLDGLIVAIARPLSGMALAIGVLFAADALGHPFSPRDAAQILLFGALPPAVLNYLFAERYHQEPEIVASMVLVGNAAALVVLPMALALVLAY
ncbi:AEC family transporter [Hydrogenophilus thiooxidans]|uniref:AEC family transporter n=1 Tax=Hydrogenophilus thiooxidans TaxID=2820326 RepID=UPI001C24E437|nr:AEC family transporter [Hydrogenophilus thiooxidans]